MSNYEQNYSETEQKMIDEAIKASLAGDRLAKYSARDLVSALHWTSKTDLKPSLYNKHEIDESWENLREADLALHRFYDFELAKIIEAYKVRERDGEFE